VVVAEVDELLCAGFRRDDAGISAHRQDKKDVRRIGSGVAIGAADQIADPPVEGASHEIEAGDLDSGERLTVLDVAAEVFQL
jgi:hypothetical protein